MPIEAIHDRTSILFWRLTERVITDSKTGKARAIAKNFFPLLGYLTLQPIALIGYLISMIPSPQPFVYTNNTAAIEDWPVDTITAITANVCGLPGGLPRIHGGMKPARVRLADIIDFIQEKNPQVLCLQEVWDPELRDGLVEELTNVYPHIYSKIGSSRWGFDSGLFVASRFPTSDVKHIPFENCGSWPDNLIHRGVFTFKIGEHKFGVTHFQPGDSKTSIRETQAKQIPEDCNVIMGDLNTRNHDHTHFFPDYQNSYDGEPTHLNKSKTLDYVLTKGDSQANITSCQVSFSDHLALIANIHI